VQVRGGSSTSAPCSTRFDVPATEPEGPADSWNWFRSYGDENWEFKMKCSSIVASSTGTVTTRHSHCALADTDAALAA
jgi:hypothetical protein